MTDEAFTPISDLGEFGLIERIRQSLGPAPAQVEIAIGDDTAAVVTDAGELLLITTDALIEHIHFDRTYTPMRHLGYKAIAANVSDIAAMNGRSRFATVSIGLPNSVSVEMVDALYQGMKDAAIDYDLAIVGGDTSAGHKLMLSICLIGDCRPEEMTRRSGGENGDVLCVTGTLGASYAGLRILQHHKERMLEEGEGDTEGEGYRPDLSEHSAVIERHLRPRARTDVIAKLRELGVLPKAMIDVSDGLASDVRHLCTASGCGVDIELDSIPVSDETRAVAALLGESVEQYSLRGGEDYELLFAIDASDESALRDLDDVHVIGRFREADYGIRITRDGMSEELDAGGFAHF